MTHDLLADVINAATWKRIKDSVRRFTHHPFNKNHRPKVIYFSLGTPPETITREQIEEAEAAFRARPTDNSPQLERMLVIDIIKEVGGLNMPTLSNDLDMLCLQMPALIDSRHRTPDGQTRNGYRMAVAFETGRRYAILQVLTLVSEEVETLPTKPTNAPHGPELVA